MEDVLTMISRFDESSAEARSLKSAYDYVRDRLRDEESPVITVDQADVFERVYVPRGITGSPRAPVVESLVVTLYASATAALRSRPTALSQATFADAHDRVEKWFRSLTVGTLGDYLTQVEAGALRDPGIAQQLDTAAASVRRLLGRSEELHDRFEALLRPRQPGDDCACILRACNSSGDCRYFCEESWLTCVLIFLGFLILIIIVAL
jgi:hypothetical protein